MNKIIGNKVLMLLDNPFLSDVRVHKEATTLIKQGISVTVLCTIDNTLAAEEEKDGILIHRKIPYNFISPYGEKYKDFISNMISLIGMYKYDILHCHDFHMLSLGSEIKKINPKIKLIYDAHEYLVGWPYYLSSPKWFNRIKGKLVWKRFVENENKSISNCDNIITVTDSIAKKLKSNNKLSIKPTVIGNYPPTIKLKSNKNYFQEKFQIDKNAKILVHSGTIYHTEKQLLSLFKIVSSINNLSLVFIGNRPRFYEVQNMVNSISGLNKIFFHEYYNNQEENINLISCGDIGLLHVRDKWEAHRITFSNRFVEYLAAGLPVLGTPQDFAKSINDVYGCCKFYNEDDFNQLKNGLKHIIENLEQDTKKAELAKKNLSWELESKKLLELYNTLL